MIRDRQPTIDLGSSICEASLGGDDCRFTLFSNHDADRVSTLSGFSSRRWGKNLQWLDDAGPSFCFLQAERVTRRHHGPAWALFRLERDFRR